MTRGADTDEVIVASGLPRAGTSLVMQLLVASGVPVVSDGQRPADGHNPRGYFEYQPVRGILRDTRWVAAARGRAVKVVAPLLPALPGGEVYRVLFVHRDLEEVLASQRAMLGAKAPDPAQDALLGELLAREVEGALAWARRTPGVTLVELKHRALLAAEPATLRHFLALARREVGLAALAEIPAAELWRQRRVPPTR